VKAKKIDHAALAKRLRSVVRGRVGAQSGYFGALQVAEEVRRRFQRPSGGGRARDPRWTEKRLLPVRPETLARLQRLADQVSDVLEHRVDPLQIAAVLIERNLDEFGEADLATSIAGGATK
jgi:hypothetical protein